MSTREKIQLVLWGIPVVSGLGMGIPDRIYQSFYPEFSQVDFASIFFSLFLIMCVAGSFPLLNRFIK
jgi:hypothetical protein